MIEIFKDSKSEGSKQISRIPRCVIFVDLLKNLTILSTISRIGNRFKNTKLTESRF